MDKGFASVVAVAVLGCAVILAVAFQISEGLAMEEARRGGEPGSAREVDEASIGGDPEFKGAASAAKDTAATGRGGFHEESLSDKDVPGAAPANASALDQTQPLTSAALGSGSMSSGQQGTPVTAKEINPAGGHTVSPQPADEIEERARKGPHLQDSQIKFPNMTGNGPDSESAPVSEASNGTAGVAAGEAPPAIEMIRGTRRSTESIAAAENED